MKNKKTFWLVTAFALSLMAVAPRVAAQQQPPFELNYAALQPLGAQVGDGFELDKKPAAASGPNRANAINTLQNANDTTSGVFKSVSPSMVAVGGVATYTLRIQNADNITTTFYLTDALPAGVSYVLNSLKGPATYDAASKTIYASATLRPSMNYGFREAATPIPFVDVRGLGGTISLCASFQSCDDSALNVNLAPDTFRLYDTVTSTLAVVSNGYVKVGLAASGDVIPELPGFPNPAKPNSVLAPFATDLDLDGSAINDSGFGGVYIAKLAGHPSFPGKTVAVIQYQDAVQYTENPIVPPANLPQYTFQVIAVAGTEQYYVVYANTTSLYTPTLVIGAENGFGNVGSTYYLRNGAQEQGVFPASTPSNNLTLELYSYPVAEPNMVEVTFNVVATQQGAHTNTAVWTTNLSGTSMQASAQLVAGGRAFLPVVLK